jgi:hypothetical protein
MTLNIPSNGKWIKKFPKEVQPLLAEKLQYGNRLTDVLENIRTAALGIDPQSKMQLRLLEKDVVKVLRKTHDEIKELVQAHMSEYEMNKYQGKLFDV